MPYQYIGHIFIKGETIKLLCRRHPTYVALKLRQSGNDGVHLDDEEIYLNQSSAADLESNIASAQALTDLLAGKVVKI